MIRILQVLGGLERGGAETMVMNLYREVDRSQIQFDFIIHTSERQAYYDEVIGLGGKIYAFPAFTGKNWFEMRRIWNRFFREHPEYRILHSHVRSYASLYLPIAKAHGLKTIIHSHSTSNGSGLKAAIKGVMQYPLRYQADYFFSCSKEAGQWLFGKRVEASDKHNVLMNAIDAEKYRYNEKVRNAYRSKLGLENKNVFVHVGRFHPAKNHSFLLRVFARIRERQSNAMLLLIGDGETRHQIEAQINQLHLQDAVLLPGSTSDVHNLLQAADCFLFPSAWEGLGIVAVEAQAAGLPCLCSDQVPQLVKVTEQCWFLPLEEETWVNAATSAFAERTDTYHQIVEAHFDVHTTAEWLSEFYRGLWG